MKRRIAVWAFGGVAVGCTWALIAVASAPNFGHWQHSAFWKLAEITCPISVVGKYVPVKLYTAIIVNAITYAALGLGVEVVRLTLLRSRRTA